MWSNGCWGVALIAVAFMGCETGSAQQTKSDGSGGGSGSGTDVAAGGNDSASSDAAGPADDTASVGQDGGAQGDDTTVPPDTGGPQPCGGDLPTSCPAGWYCHYELADGCGFADEGGVCRERPNACDLDYSPVCGCDNTTYGNACGANAAGTSVQHVGECEVTCGGFAELGCPAGQYCDYPVGSYCGGDDSPGVCKHMPETCAGVVEPVCGCDGQTYSNACMANSQGVSVATQGACGEAKVCGGLGGAPCPAGSFCDYALGDQCGAADQTGLCKPRPVSACPKLYAPVCGCDGETYDNECFANAAGTSVASTGSCGGAADICGGWLAKTCEPGMFCDYALDAICGWADASGTCQPIPEACTQEYAPVCGCDGKTYSNACMAHGAAIAVQKNGACDAPTTCGGFAGTPCVSGQFCNYPIQTECGATDQPGTCQDIPTACTEELAWVCGCDGQTYQNACMAHAAGTSVAAQGKCGGTPTCGGFAGLQCPPGEFCDYAVSASCGAGDQPGTCQVKPDVCPFIYSPVCGCDGQTYGNTCEAHGAGTAVASAGECGGMGSSCHSSQECTMGFCLTPGASLGCGICMEPLDPCAEDSDCGSGNVCLQSTIADCLCSPAMLCKPACTGNDDCKTGEVCGGDGHCAPAPCSAAADCPANFGCGSGSCQRLACASDAACAAGGGFCVNGACYETLGACMLPPP